MKTGNIIEDKSFTFAVRIINVYKYFASDKKEFILSKQLLRCGTSIGALIKEAVCTESKADFIHKLHIALKEANETHYWLLLLQETDYLTKEQFESLNNDCTEILKLLTSIIKSTKYNQQQINNN